MGDKTPKKLGVPPKLSSVFINQSFGRPLIFRLHFFISINGVWWVDDPPPISLIDMINQIKCVIALLKFNVSKSYFRFSKVQITSYQINLHLLSLKDNSQQKFSQSSTTRNFVRCNIYHTMTTSWYLKSFLHLHPIKICSPESPNLISLSIVCASSSDESHEAV